MASSSSSFIICLTLYGFWNCQSVRRWSESSFVSIGRSSQSLLSSCSSDFGRSSGSLLAGTLLSSSCSNLGSVEDSPLSFIWELSAGSLSAFTSPAEASAACCGFDSVGASTLTSSSSSSEGAMEDSREGTLGSGPMGLSSGARRRYCLRRAVCQLSMLGGIGK